MLRLALSAALIGLTLLAPSPAAARLYDPPPPAGANVYAARGVTNYTFLSGPGRARRYQIRYEGHAIDVYLSSDIPEPSVGRLLKFSALAFSFVPYIHRDAVKTIEFGPPKPADAKRNAELAPNMGPNPIHLASARGTTIGFHRLKDGAYGLQYQVFLHEVGHCVARSGFGRSFPASAWTRAALSDRHTVSDYAYAAYAADNNFTEDFAEAYSNFLLNYHAPEKSAFHHAQSAQEAYILDNFTRLFPGRSKFLAVLTGLPVVTEAAPVATPVVTQRKPRPQPQARKAPPAKRPQAPKPVAPKPSSAPREALPQLPTSY